MLNCGTSTTAAYGTPCAPPSCGVISSAGDSGTGGTSTSSAGDGGKGGSADEPSGGDDGESGGTTGGPH